MRLEIIAIIGIFAGMLLFGNMIMTISHEEAHAQIDKYAGLKPTTITENFGLFGGAKTIAIGNLSMDRDTYILAHDFNESIGYQLQPFLVIITASMVAVLVGILFLVNNTTRQNK